MKVLFVSSGNSKNEIGALVKNQGVSLIKQGVEVSFFGIKGKGLIGYFQNIRKLRSYINCNQFDIIHAHYSFSGFTASLAFAKPLVVSLMGSDVFSTFPFNKFIKIFKFFFWKATIVKTEEMKLYLNDENILVLPNGVDLNRFKLIEKNEAKEKVGFIKNKRYIIFVANPKRPEKNYELALNAMNYVNKVNVELFVVSGVENEIIPIYMNAADLLILTSKWEGSVNVVKEAMACNCPIVSTNVGDVKRVMGSTEGCYIASNDPIDFAKKLNLALSFSLEYGRTKGRERIIELGLDSINISNKIIDLYKQVINKK